MAVIDECSVASLANLFGKAPPPAPPCVDLGGSPATTTTPTVATFVAPTTTTTIGVNCVNYYGGAVLPSGSYLGKFQAGDGPTFGSAGSWYIDAGYGQPEVCTFQ